MSCKKKQAKCIPANGEVLMLIQFKGDMKQRMINAFSRCKSIISNYQGKLLGITDDVQVLEGDEPGSGGVALLQFDNRKHAEMWCTSDPVFRQADWPSPADSLNIAIFPMEYLLAENGFHTFQLMELSDFTCRDFQDRYVNKVTPLMDKNKVWHGLVAADRDKISSVRWRFFGRDTFVLLNAYESKSHFEQFYYSNDYQDLKSYRQRACSSRCILFTV